MKEMLHVNPNINTHIKGKNYYTCQYKIGDIIIIIIYSLEFFISVLADGLSIEFE